MSNQTTVPNAPPASVPASEDIPPERVFNPIMKHFTWEHLKHQEARDVSKEIGQLAIMLNLSIPDGPEKSAGLRKLLEAKDALVRAVLP